MIPKQQQPLGTQETRTFLQRRIRRGMILHEVQKTLEPILGPGRVQWGRSQTGRPVVAGVSWEPDYRHCGFKLNFSPDQGGTVCGITIKNYFIDL